MFSDIAQFRLLFSAIFKYYTRNDEEMEEINANLWIFNMDSVAENNSEK